MPLSTPLGPVRIVMVEDCAEDAELLAMQLADAGIEADLSRVETEEEFRDVLVGDLDLVLSDVSLPRFCGYRALEILRESDRILPFIFVSGTIGEDSAVQALQRGANDYILKHSPARLPTAVARAIREARFERERERTEKELMRSQRLDCLAMLAAGLSHDLRNVLQPLLIIPDLLETYSDDPNVRRLGALISESAQRGHEMAESMLSFVRGSRKAAEEIDIGQLLEAVEMLLKGSVRRPVQLVVQLPAQKLIVHGNHTELQQCLVNLCLNGVQAMHQSGGTLRVSAHASHDGGIAGVTLRVSDQGCGMDAQALERLFTPFFTTKEKGTGLGLLSCKRIVDGMRGRIDVRSEQGQGTTFDIWVPCAVETDSAAYEGPYREGRAQRIVIVDGDATRASLLVNALSSQGYEPVHAADGAAALRELQRRAPHLVIIDSEILHISALNLLWALQDAGYRGRVVVLEDERHGLPNEELPGDIRLTSLRKPIEMSALFHTVEAALSGEQVPATA